MIDEIELYPVPETTNLSKEDVEVTIPSKEEIEGKSKVFQKVGAVCGEAYWTSTPSRFDSWRLAREFFVYFSGELSDWNVNRGLGVRPVLKSDNPNELIKCCKSHMDDGIQVIEYGKFPHMLTDVKINYTSVLEETGQQYILPTNLSAHRFSLVRFKEYDYLGQKVVKRGNFYYPVKPIEWYFDKKNNMLISKEVLFWAPINVDNPNYDGSFETSQLYSYLNNDFLKQLKFFPYPNLTDNDDNQLAITPKDKAELESRIERLLKQREMLLNQSESLDNELRNGQKVKLL